MRRFAYQCAVLFVLFLQTAATRGQDNVAQRTSSCCYEEHTLDHSSHALGRRRLQDP